MFATREGDVAIAGRDDSVSAARPDGGNEVACFVAVTRAERKAVPSGFGRTPAGIDFEERFSILVIDGVGKTPVLPGASRVVGDGEVLVAGAVQEIPQLSKRDLGGGAFHVVCDGTKWLAMNCSAGANTITVAT